jgi:hypothetical protein
LSPVVLMMTISRAPSSASSAKLAFWGFEFEGREEAEGWG